MFFKESEIEFFIEEDLPYFDLTTDALGISKEEGRIDFIAREKSIVSCSEEAARILEKLGASVIDTIPSGSEADPNSVILRAEGSAESLHKAWKVCQNLLEYAGGIATYTRNMHALAWPIPIFVTRKSQPGFKKIAMKSVLNGGGHPHRLGLSETFLLFRNHRAFLEDDKLLDRIEALQKAAMLEKTMAVETDALDDAIQFAERGIRLFQLEKFPPALLAETVKTLKKRYPDIRLLATGGIRLENVEAYAKTGVDGLITTAPYYYAAPADIGVRIEKI
ncbi:ModD protein [Hydrogenimonas cancrithermarum]|uniref:Putative pyrophosphorylase ModD n=1 Tax=Hydrogenimonas cancrithermarum TaxID=2993563 RepID=A0ABN6WTA6_9BACT|nr:ModD protein [Hydrogenimonas cancrithermarum]BDY12370.1 ModD protein [Hydrogenimonas cancrithermarum]